MSAKDKQPSSSGSESLGSCKSAELKEKARIEEMEIDEQALLALK